MSHLISTQYKHPILLLIDRNGCIIENITYAAPEGLEQESVPIGDAPFINQSIHDLFHADISIDNCCICNAIKQLDEPVVFTVEKGEQYFDIHLSPYKSNDNKSLILHSCYDVTHHRLANKNLKLINRLYNMLRLANQAIFKHGDENTLLQELCDIAINTGKFELSWFGTLDNKTITPHVFGGIHKEYIDTINIDISNSRQMNGPVARAFNSNSICYVNNISTDDGFTPWRKKAEKMGFKSVVVMPWRKNGLPIGVFALYSAELDAFDAQTLDMITNLNHDLSHILKYMDVEKDRRIVEKQLFELSTAIDQSKSAVMITDMNLVIEYVNKFFCEVSGYSESQLLGGSVFDSLKFIPESQKTLDHAWSIVKGGRNWEGSILLKSVDRQTYWYYLTVAPVFSGDGKIRQVIWTGRDNTELHNAQQTISELAFYDSLTKLPNRRLYYDNIARAIRRAERQKVQFAVLFFDIDQFKAVNDTMGHDYGDLLLQHMAQTLIENVKDSDTIARLGGDEFTIILENIESVQQIESTAKKIICALNKPVTIDGSIMSISTSVGASVYPLDGKDGTTLMKKADMAMYHAKSSGKNILKIFDGSIQRDHIQREKIQQDIQQALADEDFQLYFQPQMCLHSNELIGVELLLRWLHPTLGWLAPDTFIPVAEKSDLIFYIDQWVLQKACCSMKALMDKGFPRVKIAINISAVCFKHPDRLFEAITSALSCSGLDASLLQIEMTETSLVQDAELVIRTINKIKEIGVSFAIDDFGTGYSSLAYIRRFPVDMIKIDRSFVCDLEDDKDVRSIVKGIINISHSLGLGVVAEGVECHRQLEYLRGYGCDCIQGFLYAEPMSIDRLDEFIKHNGKANILLKNKRDYRRC